MSRRAIGVLLSLTIALWALPAVADGWAASVGGAGALPVGRLAERSGGGYSAGLFAGYAWQMEHFDLTVGADAGYVHLGNRDAFDGGRAALAAELASDAVLWPYARLGLGYAGFTRPQGDSPKGLLWSLSLGSQIPLGDRLALQLELTAHQIIDTKKIAGWIWLDVGARIRWAM